MALPIPGKLTVKPRNPLAQAADDQYPNSRLIAPLIWFDIDAEFNGLTLAQRNELDAWRTYSIPTWVASFGLSGFTIRPVEFGQHTLFNTANSKSTVKLEARQNTKDVTSTYTQAWPSTVPCPIANGTTITRFEDRVKQQFSSNRSRIVRRRKGAMATAELKLISLTPTQFSRFIAWWRYGLGRGDKFLTASWLTLFGSYTKAKIMEPWQASMGNLAWDVTFKVVVY